MANVRGRTNSDKTIDFYDEESGQVLLTLDPVNNQVKIPTGAALAGGAGSVTVAAPDGLTLDTNGAGSTLEVAAGGLDTTRFAEYALGGLQPGAQVVFAVDVADHATQNVDEVIAQAMTVLDAWVIPSTTNGANANTWQLDNGTGGNHITDAMSTNGTSSGGIVRAATIDPTHSALADGATLRIVQTTAGGANGARVVIVGILA